MYYLVPITKGLLDVDYEYMEQGIQISDTSAYVKLREGYTIRESWQAITEEEWQAVLPVMPDSVPIETTEQKLARLEEQNLILMDALATTFEELLELRVLVEGGTV